MTMASRYVPFYEEETPSLVKAFNRLVSERRAEIDQAYEALLGPAARERVREAERRLHARSGARARRSGR
jgi:hypothetical protein